MSIFETICEWVRNSMITVKVTALAGHRHTGRAGRETPGSKTISMKSVGESLPGPGTGQPSVSQGREAAPDTAMGGPVGSIAGNNGIFGGQGEQEQKPGLPGRKQGLRGQKPEFSGRSPEYPGGRPGPDIVSREDRDRWTVTVHPASPFEKVGRVLQDHGDLILRSDLDPRGFFIAEEDVRKALAGGTGEVWLLDSPGQVGTVRLSVSGRALNMTIDGDLHTVPLRLLMLVIEGKRRKLALFKGV